MFGLSIATDVVGLARPPSSQHLTQGAAVILHVEPVADLQPVPYTGSGLPCSALRIISGISFSGK